MIDLKKLEVRPGQRIDAAFFRRKWRGLLTAIAERTVKRGAHVRLRHGPDGVTVNAGAGRGGGYVAHPWQMSVDAGAQVTLVRFRRGLIDGLEPTIDGEPMGTENAAGETTALEVLAEHFDERRIARIYVKVVFEGFAWFAKSAEMVAASSAPEPAPFTCHKLIGLLVRDSSGTVMPESRAFFDLRIVPMNTTDDGAAIYVPGVT